MTTTRKVMIGIGMAGGALLAAWLLSGERGRKTKQFVAKKAVSLKKSLKKGNPEYDDSEIHYV